MADFFQNGSITTLHNLTRRSVEDLERELSAYSQKRSIGLVLPKDRKQSIKIIDLQINQSFEIDYTFDGENLPYLNLDANLILPDGPLGRAFLVYNNFYKIKKYNASTYYALSIGILADRIKY